MDCVGIVNVHRWLISKNVWIHFGKYHNTQMFLSVNTVIAGFAYMTVISLLDKLAPPYVPLLFEI